MKKILSVLIIFVALLSSKDVYADEYNGSKVIAGLEYYMVDTDLVITWIDETVSYIDVYTEKCSLILNKKTALSNSLKRKERAIFFDLFTVPFFFQLFYYFSAERIFTESDKFINRKLIVKR